MRITIVPVGELGPEGPLLHWLKERLGIIFMVPSVEVGPRIEHPSYAYDPSRGQYRASDILRRLRRYVSSLTRRLDPAALLAEPEPAGSPGSGEPGRPWRPADSSRDESPVIDTKVLGVADVDLFAGGLNFVFGQAELPGSAAIISLCRLRPEFYGEPPNEALKRRRLLIEAVHELGHTFGLDHCDSNKCVMRFSNALADTDAKGYDFCFECLAALAKELKWGARRE